MLTCNIQLIPFADWCQVETAQDCIGARVEEQIKQLQPGHVLLLENTRFHKGEEKNDPLFSKQVWHSVSACPMATSSHVQLRAE